MSKLGAANRSEAAAIAPSATPARVQLILNGAAREAALPLEGSEHLTERQEST
jgi:hypothetical protein